MNYDDFPILDDMTYKIMQEQYSLSNTDQADRYEILATALNCLATLLNCEISNTDQFKKSIVLALNNSKIRIENIYNSILKTFNTDPVKINHTRSYNIFEYLNKLLSIFINIDKLENVQEKPYYKQNLNQNKNAILEIISNILSSLESSSVHFFRYI